MNSPKTGRGDWASSLVLATCTGAFLTACAGGQPVVPEATFQLLAACESSVRNAPVDVTDSSITARPARRYLELASLVPGGFAGLRLDETTRKSRMMLVDTSQEAAARAFLVSLRAGGELTMTAGLSDADLAVLPAEPVRWSYVQLYDWLQYLSRLTLGEAVAAGATVRGIGITPMRNAITISVGDEGSRAKVEALLASHNVPCSLVGTEITGPWIR